MSTSLAIVPIGKSVAISASGTVSVANVATGTNTFRFLTANATAYSYVGVFSTYAEAAAMDHPTAGGTTGAGVIMAPNWPDVITGNFGVNPNPGTVYVAAITAGSSGVTVIATPIAP